MTQEVLTLEFAADLQQIIVEYASLEGDIMNNVEIAVQSLKTKQDRLREALDAVEAGVQAGQPLTSYSSAMRTVRLCTQEALPTLLPIVEYLETAAVNVAMFNAEYQGALAAIGMLRGPLESPGEVGVVSISGGNQNILLGPSEQLGGRPIESFPGRLLFILRDGEGTGVTFTQYWDALYSSKSVDIFCVFANDSSFNSVGISSHAETTNCPLTVLAVNAGCNYSSTPGSSPEVPVHLYSTGQVGASASVENATTAAFRVRALGDGDARLFCTGAIGPNGGVAVSASYGSGAATLDCVSIADNAGQFIVHCDARGSGDSTMTVTGEVQNAIAVASARGEGTAMVDASQGTVGVSGTLRAWARGSGNAYASANRVVDGGLLEAQVSEGGNAGTTLLTESVSGTVLANSIAGDATVSVPGSTATGGIVEALCRGAGTASVTDSGSTGAFTNCDRVTVRSDGGDATLNVPGYTLQACFVDVSSFGGIATLRSGNMGASELTVTSVGYSGVATVSAEVDVGQVNGSSITATSETSGVTMAMEHVSGESSVAGEAKSSGNVTITIDGSLAGTETASVTARVLQAVSTSVALIDFSGGAVSGNNNTITAVADGGTAQICTRDMTSLDPSNVYTPTPKPPA